MIKNRIILHEANKRKFVLKQTFILILLFSPFRNKFLHRFFSLFKQFHLLVAVVVVLVVLVVVEFGAINHSFMK